MKYVSWFIYISYSFLLIITLSLPASTCAQPLNQKNKFTIQDTLRGSITPERAWWNVVSYNIFVLPDINTKTISGWNQVSFDINEGGKNKKMQIDLQQPLVIDSIIFNNHSVQSFSRNGNVYIIDFADYEFISARASLDKHHPVILNSIKIFYHGKPREATRPPWNGGWIWESDEKGRPWMTVACQGLGASVWYPCKDHQSDEPDQGALIQIKVPDTLVAVANGRLYSNDDQHNGTMLYT
ncbi:MAG: M1 family peptidase, partial [Chitinophagaceae bacterium]